MEDLDKTILAYCVNDTVCLTRCMGDLSARYFQNECKVIFDAIKCYYKDHRKCPSAKVLEHHLDSKAVDPEVVVECVEIYQEVKDEEIELDSFEFFLKNIKKRAIYLEWASLVAGSATDRKGNPILPLDEIMESDPDQAFQLLTKKVGYAVEQLKSGDAAERGYISEFAKTEYQAYEEVKKNPELAYGLRTGYDVLDEESGGMREGELWLVSGATGEGKSVFMINVAVNAYKSGKNVLLVSIEMPRVAYMRRFFACYCNVPSHSIKLGQLSSAEESKYKSAIKEVSKNEDNYLAFLGIPNATALTIEAEVNRVLNERETLPDVIIVDYLGIMKSIEKGRADWEEQTQACLELRTIARVYNVPILTAVQLNRDKKKSKNADRISRASGIAHTADLVLQIEERPDEEKTEEIDKFDDSMKMFFVKHRDGKGHFSFQLWKKFAHMKLRNWDEQYTETLQSIEDDVKEEIKKRRQDEDQGDKKC